MTSKTVFLSSGSPILVSTRCIHQPGWFCCTTEQKHQRSSCKIKWWE